MSASITSIIQYFICWFLLYSYQQKNLYCYFVCLCNFTFHLQPTFQTNKKKSDTFSICACHPCAGAMLIFSVSFQFLRMTPEGVPTKQIIHPIHRFFLNLHYSYRFNLNAFFNIFFHESNWLFHVYTTSLNTITTHILQWVAFLSLHVWCRSWQMDLLENFEIISIRRHSRIPFSFKNV